MNASVPVPRCYLCNSSDAELKGDGGFKKRCRNEIECQRRIAEARLPQFSDTPPRATKVASAQRATAPSSQTAAEAMIALLQQNEYANVGKLDGPWELSDQLHLPIQAAQVRYTIFGKTGSGKSNVSRVQAENCLDNNIPVQVLDALGNMHGLRSKGKHGAGLPVVILGGPYGDIPLQPTDGELVADLFAAGHSAILDLSEMPTYAQQDFGTDYFTRLLRVLRRPAHLIMEEGETFAAAFTKSKSQFHCTAAATLFARQIRNFGAGWTISTQQMALLAPQVYSSASAFVAMLSTGDEVQQRIGREARSRLGRDVSRAIINELGRLRCGEAWILPDPDWLGTSVGAPRRLTFRMSHTFDSTAIPQIGKPAIVRPPSVPVDLRPFQPLVDRHDGIFSEVHTPRRKRK